MKKELQDALKKQDVNSLFYEMQKLGHIAFAEISSTPKNKSGILYMPKGISEKQRKTLKKVQEQLIDEDYNIMLLSNLHRNEEGIMVGSQDMGKANLLDDFTEEQER